MSAAGTAAGPDTGRGPADTPHRVLRLRCVGVPESSLEQLTSLGAQLVDDGEVDAVVVSTRLAATDLRSVTGYLGDDVGRTVVLAHTGAERLAADLVREGADAVVGEGNEEALVGLIDPERTPAGLLASFERRFGSGGSSNAHGIDPGTGLADARSFERRIAGLGDSDDVPRVAYLKVVSDMWSTPSPDAVVGVQRRRLATALAHVAGGAGAELFTSGTDEFGLISTDLGADEMARTGLRFVQAAATFRDRGLPLRLVVGHAGPESTHDAEELLDLARRAVEVAAADEARQVLGAEDLAMGVSVTTELEAVVRLLDEVEPVMVEGRRHGERVGRMAAELARLYGCPPGAVARIHLAGHLHDIGRAGLPPEAVGGPEGLEGELLDAWRTFPVRSAELLRLTAGPAVAEAVRAQRERFDGEGFPDGRKGNEIPEAARILSVAHTLDELLVANRRLHPAAIAEHVRDAAATVLDPDLVGSALEHLRAILAARG